MLQKRVIENKVQLMLDSGVFSAWNRGGEINIKDYIQYLKDNRHLLFCYVNVDKIPGKFGQRKTMEQVEDSAKVGYGNLQTIKGHGLNPMPTFHQGERFYWLERMLSDGERYIGLATAKDQQPNEQARWLDSVFSLITDAQGRPLIKTHGLGVTNTALLLRYPFYTVDSTTWLLTPGYGTIIVPVYEGGKPNYLRKPVRIPISGVAHASSSGQKKQFENLGPMTQEAVLRFLHEVVGCTITEARYGTGVRRRAVLMYFMELVKHIKDVRFRHHGHNHAVVMTNKTLGIKKPETFDCLTIMYATALSTEFSHILNEAGATTRLLSYWELRDKPADTLARYVGTGTATGPYVKEAPKANWGEAHLNFRRLKLLQRTEQDEDGTQAVS